MKIQNRDGALPSLGKSPSFTVFADEYMKSIAAKALHSAGEKTPHHKSLPEQVIRNFEECVELEAPYASRHACSRTELAAKIL